MRRFASFGPALVVMAAVLAVLWGAPAVLRSVRAAQTQARIVLAQQTLQADDILERINRATRAVAESVRPSVVHIEVIPSGDRQWRARSSGSGWVYDAGGHIVTNAHVVRGAEAIRVQFADGRTAEPVRISGQPFLADPFTDIAVIRVPASGDLAPATRATGRMIQQGDRVFAFGSPFGFKFSMTEGIVGGVGRDPMTAADFGGYTNYIQHDAAVNPGNSGGPLVDVQGRVVGMNVAIATGRDSQGTTGEGQSAGISFAIPLGTIESVVGQLIERGDVARGFMGITWAGRGGVVYDDTARATGIRVVSVQRDGPADRAGLREGDLITAFAGLPVTNFEVLRSLITSSRPGDAVPVRAVREGETVEFTVTLGTLPTQVLVERAEVGREFFRFGLAVRDFDGGPRVVQVLEGSAAERAGFRAGHVIVGVGDDTVRTFAEAQVAAVESGLLVGRPVTLRVASVDADQAAEPEELEMRLVR